ncbi:MAG TPA: hypothetical protein VNP72_08580 [Longimicrobium sp.]|nr:hypothetical protein [Longimicrobium sp.]
MKKPLVLAAALVLAATPAAAQQRAQALPQAPARVEQAATPSAQPSIYVSQEEIRARVAANEAARSGEQVGSTSFWYLVAAIALGVIIASLLLN